MSNKKPSIADDIKKHEERQRLQRTAKRRHCSINIYLLQICVDFGRLIVVMI